ncbi:hypothetical protein NDU88_002828 [Pleurodeles waltl]|uniref:Receptor ligand binding region domain-containing protein n=1 Tax=Pleurodeles waltl TaxID=8319 RepID=A0AAV7SE02_PLEWA|nr:hypothetical protein NDU88_002828 [Pleurodeles waltl]
MPRGKTAGKAPCKPARQLLFSEALHQQKYPAPAASPPPSHNIMSDNTQGASMDRILQEISAVGRRPEGMDTAMSALTAETRSMRLEIAGFQSQISGLDHRVAAVESQVVSQTDRDQELLYLRSKLTDLEDRSRRNNIRFLGFPEGIEGTDILSYLRDTLPKLADVTFDPPLKFQRAHRLGLKRQNGQDRPRPIIACFLRHGQVRQLLQLSRRQGPLRLGPLEIRLSADFSKETADRRRAFLSFRPRLRHLDIGYGAGVPLLSDKIQFPSFVRTNPSTEQVPYILTQLITHFGWTWVGILGSYTDYGLHGIQELKKEFSRSNVCVAFLETLRPDITRSRVLSITRTIKESTAKVIIVYAFAPEVIPIMEELVTQEIAGKIWIASPSLIGSPLFFRQDLWNVLNGTIGLGIHAKDMPLFNEFQYRIRPSASSGDIFIRAFWEHVFRCKWADALTQVNATYERTIGGTDRCTGHEHLETLQSSVYDGSNLSSSNLYQPSLGWLTEIDVPTPDLG